MLTEVMEYYGLERSPVDVEFFETEHHAQISRDLRTAIMSGRLIALTGHSFGANAAIMIAGRLAEQDIVVDYLAAIDPAAQSALGVPLNVKRIYNPYQKVDPVGRGVVKPANGESKAHWSARAIIERRDQLHVRIDDDASVHRNIVAAIQALTVTA